MVSRVTADGASETIECATKPLFGGLSRFSAIGRALNRRRAGGLLESRGGELGCQHQLPNFAIVRVELATSCEACVSHPKRDRQADEDESHRPRQAVQMR